MDIINIKKEKGELFKILHETDRSQLGVMTIGPGEDSGQEETHEGDQIVYVIEGEAEVDVETEEGKLVEGDALIIPAKSRHHIRNKGIETAFLLCIYAPPSY